jgi:hypothetical protein
MKKFGLLLLVGFMVFGSMAFAAEGSSPAEIYAGLTGKTVEEAYEARGQGRFGALAKEEGVSEDFVAQMLAAKKVQINSLVGDSLTQEEADALIAEMEARVAECDGTQEQARLLQGYAMQFGDGLGLGSQYGKADGGQGQGGQMKGGNHGAGNQNARGSQDGSGLRAQDGTCVVE